ncbi:MAG: hypothetical protein NUV97_03505 [archaeon]|nr:hypothetical protein [archaeon]
MKTEEVMKRIEKMKAIKKKIAELNKKKQAATSDSAEEKVCVQQYRKTLEYEREFILMKKDFYNIVCIMSKVEAKVLKELNDEGHKVPYGLNPVKTNYIALLFSFKENYLKGRVTYDLRCGDFGYGKIKIPYEYFELEKEDLEEAHRKWARKYILEKIENARIARKKEIINKIEKLETELKEIS